MPNHSGCCRLLLALVCAIASANSQAQTQTQTQTQTRLPTLGQQTQAAQQNTRLYSVSLAESKYVTLFNGMRNVFSAPGTLSQPDPRRLRVQVGGATADIQFADNGSVIIAGEEKLAGQLQRLIQLIDKVDPTRGVQVLRLNSRGRVAFSQFSRQTAPAQANTPFRQASFPTPVTPQDGAPTTPQQGSSGKENPLKQKTKLALPQFGEVDVDILPEIDAIIIRGREKQLGELAEIIRRLDAASREAQPQIELIPLKHVQARAIGTVVQEQVEELTNLRQGTVSVTPITSPNALLLVGWGESMTLIKNLIARLDTPVHPDSGFVVIPLKHTTAEQATTQLQAFFTSRGGSVPSVQADGRTNSLIVHSSSNDLAQIRRLLESIDSPRTKSMQQAKVFPIRHSLAADVAQALEQAIAPPGTGTSMQLLDEAGKPLATSGILGQSSITVNERNNTLIVSTASENLELIANLIRQIDVPGRIASIKIFPVVNGNAASMVETLRALIPSQTGASVSPQLSSAPGESSLLPLRFTVDARGNNVIAIGSDGDLRIVEALVVRLDESDTMQRKNKVYQLKNSP
ncbi:MAG: secretin N-terminal domain-containing protein, partial [Planctomycetota bacterium]